MQNLGFAYSLIPLVKSLGDDQGQKQRLLSRHMQFFNSHPYMTSPILGSVVQIEETNLKNVSHGISEEALTLKNTLSGPYAAIGDSFFLGAYRPLSALVGVFFAIEECFAAPLLTCVMYNTVHLWIRWKGFFEGYRLGKQGIDFVRYLDLPKKSGKIRWVSLFFLALIAVLLSSKGIVPVPFFFFWVQMILKIGGLLCILLCFWGINKGISPVHILYGMAIIIFFLSY
jgi:PTS system mannose-specific IID component